LQHTLGPFIAVQAPQLIEIISPEKYGRTVNTGKSGGDDCVVLPVPAIDDASNMCRGNQWLVGQHDDDSVGVFPAGVYAASDTRSDAKPIIRVLYYRVSLPGGISNNLRRVTADNQTDIAGARTLCRK